MDLTSYFKLGYFRFNGKYFLVQWKNNNKKIRGFKKNCRYFKFNDNKIIWRQIFEILIIHKLSLGSRDVPHKIWSRSVQPFLRFLDSNKQTASQADRQAKLLFYLKILNGTLIIFCCSSVWKSVISISVLYKSYWSLYAVVYRKLRQLNEFSCF